MPSARLWGTGQNPNVGLAAGTYGVAGYNADKETLGNPKGTLGWLWLKALSSSWTRTDAHLLVQVSSFLCDFKSLLSSRLGPLSVKRS